MRHGHPETAAVGGVVLEERPHDEPAFWWSMRGRHAHDTQHAQRQAMGARVGGPHTVCRRAWWTTGYFRLKLNATVLLADFPPVGVNRTLTDVARR